MASTFTAQDRAIHFSPYRNASLGNTKVQVKAGATDVAFLHVVNTGTAAFLQVYDALAADVIVGTTTPTWSFWIPAAGAWDFPTSHVLQLDVGLTIAATAGVSNGTAPAANLIINGSYR